MIEISNRHCNTIIEKLPRILEMARKGEKAQTLRQVEDIRQLSLLHSQLKKKFKKIQIINS